MLCCDGMEMKHIVVSILNWLVQINDDDFFFCEMSEEECKKPQAKIFFSLMSYERENYFVVFVVAEIFSCLIPFVQINMAIDLHKLWFWS